MLALTNNKPKSEVQKDLEEFISENSQDFVDWLWVEVPKIFTPPVKVAAPAKIIKTDKKLQDVKNSESADNTKAETKKSANSKQNSDQLIKKALGDVQKSTNQKHDASKDKNTSYVETNQDGRRIINLNKSKAPESEPDRKRDFKEKDKSDSNILNRIKTKSNKDDKFKSSNLDVSLDSIIKKQKQKEYDTNSRDWHSGQKRGYYEVTEEKIAKRYS